jgi:beta-aspartyl-peptidase (threonine type)
MTNRMFSRVGNSSLIGVGTYACDTSAAFSATGAGEFFMPRPNCKFRLIGIAP